MRLKDHNRQRPLHFSEDRRVWTGIAPAIRRQVVDLLRQLMLQAFRRWLEVKHDQ